MSYKYKHSFYFAENVEIINALESHITQSRLIYRGQHRYKYNSQFTSGLGIKNNSLIHCESHTLK